MLTPAERAEAERQALQRCSDFETLVSNLIYAGFPDSDPRVDVLTRDEIVEFVRARFGELFVGFCKQLPQFIVH
jgi:hypothetical protein